MTVKSVFLFFSLIYLPGIIFVNITLRKKYTLIEILFLQILFGLLYNCLIMLLLLCLEVFSLYKLLFFDIILLTLLVIYMFIKKKYAFHISDFKNEKKHIKKYILLIFFFLLAILLYQSPSEYILSFSLDAANYLTQASYQTHSNTIFLKNAQTEIYKIYFPNAKYKVNSTTSLPLIDDIHREFPFPPLWKMVLTTAIFIGGLKFSLYMPLFLGLLTSLGLFIFLQKLEIKTFYSFAALSLFLYSPLIIQFMRITLSEVFTIYIIIGFLVVFYIAMKEKNNLLALISAITISSVFLIRGDGISLYAGLVIFIFLYSFIDSEYFNKKIVRVFGGSFLIISIFFWFLSLYTTKTYMVVHLKKLVPVISYGLVVITLLFFVLLILSKIKKESLITIENIYKNKFIFPFIGILLGIYLLIFLYIRQSLPPDSVEYLLKKGLTGFDPFVSYTILMYITVFIILCGAIGTVLILILKKEKYFLILFIFIMGSVLYIYELHHSHYSYWASRRIIYNLFPLFVLSSIFFLEFIEEKIKQNSLLLFRIILSLLILFNLFIHNLYITYDKINYSGNTDKLNKLSRNFTQDDIVIINGDKKLADAYQLALKYYYQIEALSPYFNSISDNEFVNFYNALNKKNNRLIIIADGVDTNKRINGLFQSEVKYYEDLDMFLYIINGTNQNSNFTDEVLPSISSLTVSNSPTLYYIDSLNKHIINEENKPVILSGVENIVITGWAIDVNNKKAAGGVYICIDGKFFPASYGLDRLDVAKVLNNPEYRYTGFEATISVSGFKKGEHSLSIKILSSNQAGYYNSDKKVLFYIK